MSMEVHMSRETTAIESGATILSRVLEAHATHFTPEVAQAILQLKFDQVDIDRMHVLAEKNRQDRLTNVEWQVLQNYLLVGHLLDLLHSKARLAKMGMMSTEPIQPDFIRLYRQAFAEYGARALWNKRVLPEPTREDALVVAHALRMEGNRDARHLAEQIERACHATV